MRRVAVVLVALAVRSAAADDGIALRVERDVGTQHEPYLRLDPALTSSLEGLTQETERHTTAITLGETRIILEGIASQNVDSDTRIHEDVESRGWRAAVRLTRKLGPVQLEAWGAVENGQTRYGGGTYRDVGVALVKRFSLSRWMQAWIALSVNNRQWLDKPPDGEANATTFMLSLGTTFR
ncbi:MAG TPA: hypothetical protein VMZ53_23895 [Kofleriaceae bacterium]|nr:hypothetical protein [Kofleriaceae bacterium]